MTSSASRSYWRRWVVRLLVLLLLLVCGASLGVYALFKRAEPDYSGQVALRGMSAPVSVMRDAHGVPHIFAENRSDALRTLGYVHAGERFFQMEMQRRAGQGRLAEVIGSSVLGIDKFTRTLGLYNLAQTSFASLSSEAQGELQAYAEGVNGWLETHRDRLPPEFLLLGIRPEPWQPADSVVWGKLMALQLSHNMEMEKLRARLKGHVTEAQWKLLFPLSVGDVPITNAPLGKRAENDNQPASPAGSVARAMEELGNITSLAHAASNEWVIGGSRTVSGKPILANDPHLGLEAPILWYLARIVTPEGEMKGATVPGLPVVLLGQNAEIAWGFTTTGSDVQDLFIETVDKDDSASYRTPDGKQPFATRTETIHVKGQPDVTLNVRATRHGPVLSDIDDELARLAGEGKVMAFAFTGLGDKDRTAEALLRLNRAQDWLEFRSALTLYQTPPQNLVYADRKGNIGFYAPGLVPVRKKGDGKAPVDGASGEYDWKGMIPSGYLPQLYNPSAGFILNANNAIVDGSYPYWLGMDWQEPHRAERLNALMLEPGVHDLDRSARMQGDHVSLAARELLPYLLRLQPTEDSAKQALELLRGWDGAMDRERPEPLIFDAWLYEMNLLMFPQAEGLKGMGPLKADVVERILAKNGGSAWCGEASDCAGVIAQALDKALSGLQARQGRDMTQWRWGAEHRAILTHKVYGKISVLKWFADLSVPSSGDFYTLDRGGSFTMDGDHPFARTHGGGFRGLYDLNDPGQSRFMITTGQSGHLLSPHYGDLVPLWNEVKGITLSGTREELARQGARELRLGR